MPEIKSTGSNWISLIPYAFSSPDKPDVRYKNLQWQWWGERIEGVEQSIKLAQQQKLSVMLKPQVYIHGSWTGSMRFDQESDWELWENSYTDYIMSFVDLSVKYDIPMFCIATEFDEAALERELFFRNLINKIRSVYHGKLCYSANWDNYQNIPFWDALDYIGISAYFPLSEVKFPSKDLLNRSWEPYSKEMSSFASKLNKQILFTEFGYLSVDGCAGKTWELEQNINQLPVNEKSQATAYEALFEHFWKKDWWAGGFLWKWFPNDQGHEGYFEKDYTPQGKLAEKKLRDWYRSKH